MGKLPTYLENYKLLNSLYESSFFLNLTIYQQRSVIEALYKDPDKYDTCLISRFSEVLERDKQKKMELKYATDGLCGWKILFDVFDGKKIWLDHYKTIRGSRYGEFIWSSVKDGKNCTINQERARCFGDRIDFTLFDVKCYLNNKKTIMSFDNVYTKKFFENYIFEDFCNDLGVVGIFVDSKEYEVFNLSEKGYINKFIKESDIANFSWSNHLSISNRKNKMMSYINNIIDICRKHPKDTYNNGQMGL